MNKPRTVKLKPSQTSRVIALMAAGLLLAGLSGCSNAVGFWPFHTTPAKRTVGQAMVREEIKRETIKKEAPLELYARPGAGGVGPDGKLVVASYAKYHTLPKRPVDACGNAITPGFNSAELNDDQRTLKSLIDQQERQLRSARRTAYSANNPALKGIARDLASNNKLEIERLQHLRRQLCKDAARAIAASEKAARVH